MAILYQCGLEVNKVHQRRHHEMCDFPFCQHFIPEASSLNIMSLAVAEEPDWQLYH